MYQRKDSIPCLFAHSVEKMELEELVKAGVKVAIIEKGAYGKTHSSAEAAVMLKEHT